MERNSTGEKAAAPLAHAGVAWRLAQTRPFAARPSRTASSGASSPRAHSLLRFPIQPLMTATELSRRAGSTRRSALTRGIKMLGGKLGIGKGGSSYDDILGLLEEYQTPEKQRSNAALSALCSSIDQKIDEWMGSSSRDWDDAGDNQKKAALEALRKDLEEERSALVEKGRRARSRWAKVRGTVDKMKGFNQALDSKGASEPRDVGFSKDNKTETAGGAWLANQMGRKDIIGPASDYMGSSKEPDSKQSRHLELFQKGAHAFITGVIHRKITGETPDERFKGWGADANFVAPLETADDLIRDASAPEGEGLWTLEKELGVPPGDWVRGCEVDKYAIWRYTLKNPKKFNLRVPSGAEGQAYGPWWKKGQGQEEEQYIKGQWEPGGRTEGGKSEAVIDAIPREEFMAAKLEDKDIKVRLEDRVVENTRKHLDRLK